MSALEDAEVEYARAQMNYAEAAAAYEAMVMSGDLTARSATQVSFTRASEALVAALAELVRARETAATKRGRIWRARFAGWPWSGTRRIGWLWVWIGPYEVGWRDDESI